MKKIILLSAITFVVSAGINAQTVEFGLKGGINIANLTDQGNNTDSKTGFHAGGLAHIHFTKSFALQPEVVFSAQGAEYPDGTKRKINYINVPVLGQYMFGEGFRLQTGPQVGFLTSSKNENGNVEIDIDDVNKKVDLSWAFGASYLTTSGFGFDGRYNLGITDISKNNSDLKNRVWQFGVFYQFRH